MAYFLIPAVASIVFWFVRSYLSEAEKDYYEDRKVARIIHAIGIGALTGLVLWLYTGIMVRNVWIDDNFKKVVVAEMDTYKLVETKSGDRIVIADDGKTAYEVEDLSVSDFGDSDAKLRLYRYEANSWLGAQYQGWVEDHLYGEFPGHK